MPLAYLAGGDTNVKPPTNHAQSEMDKLYWADDAANMAA
jgi:hypothetical protein